MASQANTYSLTTDLNVSPYYDDFDESKNFHRILFRPGMAVQARELTQMQTILQNQIDRFAEHIFKEGSSVRGCEIAPLDTQYDYVKLRDDTSTGTPIDVSTFLTRIIRGETTRIQAKVVNYTDGSQADSPNFKTVYVDYLSANTITGKKVFDDDEILTTIDAGTTLSANTIKTSQGGATGFGSAISVNSGVIFAKDHFIRVNPQTLILDKYSSSPTYRVGFTIQEDLITAANDESLLDPANGAYNYAAPGADRLKLTAVLTKISDNATGAGNFVEYVYIKNGKLQNKSDAPQYSVIRDELAKRTRDESGDYIVRGLSTRVREHLLSGDNQGVYTVGEGGSADKISVDVEPGKAYVQGYDNELLVTQHVAVDKGIDYAAVSGVTSYADYGNYAVVDNVVGTWDVNGHNLVSLRAKGSGNSGQANAISTGKFSLQAPGSEIGTARVRGIEYLSGTPGLPSAQYKLYLSDIRITSAGKSFANTECIHYNAGSGYANGAADILNAVADNKTANTYDQFFTSAVFRLPATAVRRLRSTSDTVVADFGFYKLFGAGAVQQSFNSSGSLTLSSTSENGLSSEQFFGSGLLSDDLARENFHVIVRQAASTSFLSGTITVSIGSDTVTGVSTNFISQVNPGDVLACGSTDRFVVAEVISSTSLRLTQPATVARTGLNYTKRFLPGQVLDMGGVGANGTRSITITSPTTAVLNVNEPTAGGFQVSVIAKLNKTGAEEADKTVVRNALVEIKMGTSGVTGYTADTSGPWSLGLSDALKLVSVRKKTGTRFTTTTEGEDVTTHFYLDNGQRDSFYDHAKLVKKPSSSLSITGSDRLLVSVDFFTHSNRERGYFSVDSYPVDDATAGSDPTKIYTYEIPVFTSPTTGLAYDLRDCIDFRPRLTNSANTVTSVANISTNPLGIDTTGYSLTAPELVEPPGGLHFPFPGSLFETDLEYYLRRRDLIVMNKNGKCESIRGVPSLRPVTPKSDPDKMTLASIDIAPYPSLPDEIARRSNRTDLANSLRTLKNERFTMRDIGVIRDRVERLEYYTTLTLLEKEAKDISIRDMTPGFNSGTERFKNGFLVDGFTGHNVGNVYDPDYSIAIDKVRREARPPAKIDNIFLDYSPADSANIVRTNVTTAGVSRDQFLTVSGTPTIPAGSTVTVVASGITAIVRHAFDNKVYVEQATGNFAAGSTLTFTGGTTTIQTATGLTPGNLLTLPYTHEEVITQKYASTTRNTAGLAYNWIGVVTLDPNSDFWVDTTTLPDVQVNVDNSVDNWETLPNPFGSQWESWNTIVAGTPVNSVVEELNPVVSSGRSGAGRWNPSVGDVREN